MAQFYVIVLGVQGANNKVYGPTTIKDGKEVPTIVTELNFPEGNAAKLEKEGKLKRISNKQEDAKAAKEAKAAKIKSLQAEIDNAKELLDAAKLIFEGLSEEETDENKEAAKKAMDDAQLALEIANENFDKA